MTRAIVACALCALVPACSAGTPPQTDAGSGGESGSAACADRADNDADGLADCLDPGCAPWCSGVDAGPRPDVPFTECVGTPYDAMEAYAPVDIVWIVDTSGSMSDEAERVQENMQRFASAIGAVGIDWHVVMISTQAFVNVPPSLASDPRYLLVNRDVNSNESLMALLSEYPNYQSHLRRRAHTHFVAVTDDESSLEWESFREQMRVLLGRNFVFHTISSPLVPGGGPFMDGACTTGSGFPPEGAAAPGIQYWELAAATGGRALSICTPAAEWVGLFDTLTAAIAIPQRIPCEYEIPPAPSGGTLDYGRVNIRYTPASGAGVVFPYAGTTDGADCTSGGWYYDVHPSMGTPTRIILCPSSCTMITGDATGRVDVELGCASLLI